MLHKNKREKKKLKLGGERGSHMVLELSSKRNKTKSYEIMIVS